MAVLLCHMTSQKVSTLFLSLFGFNDDEIVEFAVRRSWIKARRCTASPSSAKTGVRIDASDATLGSNELKMKQMETRTTRIVIEMERKYRNQSEN